MSVIIKYFHFPYQSTVLIENIWEVFIAVGTIEKGRCLLKVLNLILKKTTLKELFTGSIIMATEDSSPSSGYKEWFIRNRLWFGWGVLALALCILIGVILTSSG